MSKPLEPMWGGKPAFTVSEAGRIGTEILRSLIDNITYLEPVAGKVYVEINLSVVDDKWFGDDRSRTSKVVVEVQLG